MYCFIAILWDYCTHFTDEEIGTHTTIIMWTSNNHTRFKLKTPSGGTTVKSKYTCSCEKVWQKKGLGCLVPVIRAMRASSSYHVNRISGRLVTCLHGDSFCVTGISVPPGAVVFVWLWVWGDFPGGAIGKEPVCQCRRCRRCGFHPWVGKIPWRREWQPTQIILAWRIPQTEEPGGLQFIGSQRIRHDWATKHTHRLVVEAFSLQKVIKMLE